MLAVLAGLLVAAPAASAQESPVTIGRVFTDIKVDDGGPVYLRGRGWHTYVTVRNSGLTTIPSGVQVTIKGTGGQIGAFATLQGPSSTTVQFLGLSAVQRNRANLAIPFSLRPGESVRILIPVTSSCGTLAGFTAFADSNHRIREFSETNNQAFAFSCLPG
ncbi:MAG: hypothetical protein HKN26_11485 [Acidimicrobiales bacterium]|nr:hypothetical protein [Acidimicrobiales bacterium]